MFDKKILEAKQIIKENIYGTLGTSGNNNLPWVSPLFISYDTELNFYFVSPKNSRHSKNIRENSITSLVLFNSKAPKWTGTAIYMVGMTKELEQKNEIEKGLKLEHNRLEEPVPSFEEFMGENEYRVYKFIPSQVWITDDLKDKKGNIIDHRREISLTDLKGAINVSEY